MTRILPATLAPQCNLSLRAVGLRPHRAKDAATGSETEYARRVGRTAAQSCVATLVLLACWATAGGAELWVSQSAGAKGSGSADAPFQTITEAIKAAKSGDTITVRKGVYREAVALNVSGTAEQPTVLRAAAGERVVVSGFAPITGWKAEGDGLFSATAEGPVLELYVGYIPQPVGRWPDLDQPMRALANPDAKAAAFQDASALPDEPFLKVLAAAPKSAMAFLYVGRSNTYNTQPVAKVDLASRTVTLAKWNAQLSGKSDRYQFANHRSLIRRPGQWATEAIDDKQTRVFFRPANAADLAKTQYPKAALGILVAGPGKARVSNVRIEGLEVCGATRSGIQVQGGDGVTISRCIVHHNAGNGTLSRNSNRVTFKNNLVFANGSGMGVASGQDCLVEGNEVFSNLVDGINPVGNVSGREGGEPTSSNITLRRNYVHHHYMLSHPDNVQAYRFVKNLVLEDNVLLLSGQGLMTEEVDGGVIRNCVIVGSAARAIIFGHGNSNDWTVENSTIGLGGWGLMGMDGKGYRLRGNIFWHNTLGIVETLASDYNFFALATDKQPMCTVAKPKWTNFLTPAAVFEATKREEHSRRADPMFRSAPACQAIVPTSDANARDRVALRVAGGGAGMADFQADDRVEINGDGVLRRITAVGADSIQFDPPLPARTFRDAIVWNWKKAASAALDLRPREGSPALTAGPDGKAVGATLDIPAFQRGDFYGTGKRAIPEMPDDLKASVPNPNDYYVPLIGR
jgi:hypothetical protein